MKILLGIIVVVAVAVGAFFFWFRLDVLEADAFTISHPRGVEVEVGSDLSGGFISPSIVKLSYSKEAFNAEGTNFSEAYLVIGKSVGKDSAAECTQFNDIQNGEPVIAKEEVINEEVFSAADTVGAAAGNRYHSRLYRTLHEGACYEIALTVHTSNIDNYPEGTVEEFNSAQAFIVLEQIFRTFEFKNNEAL